jgi:hypothetical protein
MCDSDLHDELEALIEKWRMESCSVGGRPWWKYDKAEAADELEWVLQEADDA